MTIYAGYGRFESRAEFTDRLIRKVQRETIELCARLVEELARDFRSDIAAAQIAASIRELKP